jgi:hypothetical protein
MADACIASLSASSLPEIPQCPGDKQWLPHSGLPVQKEHLGIQQPVMRSLLGNLSAAWLSEKIRICLFL